MLPGRHAGLPPCHIAWIPPAIHDAYMASDQGQSFSVMLRRSRWLWDARGRFVKEVGRSSVFRGRPEAGPSDRFRDFPKYSQRPSSELCGPSWRSHGGAQHGLGAPRTAVGTRLSVDTHLLAKVTPPFRRYPSPWPGWPGVVPYERTSILLSMGCLYRSLKPC